MIVRTKRESRFTVINNELIDDENLDWKDVGLLVYILSKPDNWEISVTHLAKQKKLGRDGIYKSLDAIIKAGYAKRNKLSNGKIKWFIYDCVVKEESDKEPDTENPEQAKQSLIRKIPNRENPNRENPTLINTDNKQRLNNLTNTDKDLFVTDAKKEKSKKEANEVSNYLANKITEQMPNSKINASSWAKDIDLAIRIDNRSKDELIDVIDWIYSPKGEFWVSNILSGKKLRQKFDQLSIKKSQSAHDGNSSGFMQSQSSNYRGNYDTNTGKKELNWSVW